MSVSVRSRAIRALAKVGSFSPDPVASSPILAHLRPGEEYVGVYEDRGSSGPKVFITSMGILIGEKQTERVEFEQLARVLSPDSKSSRGILVEMRDASVVPIPITGGEGASRDLLPFLQFLDRVLGDIEKRQADAGTSNSDLQRW